MTADHLTVREVLHARAPGNTISPEAEARARTAVETLGAKTPWYLRVLIGGGAWFGTWFLLAFLFAILGMAFDDIATPSIVVGVPLVAAAVSLQRNKGGDFLRQLALVVSLTGQALFVGGLASASNSDELAAVAAFGISAALLKLYPDRVHRFFSSVIAIGAVAWQLFEARRIVPFGLELLALALVALILALWRAMPSDRRATHAGLIDPVAAGAVASLLGLSLLATLMSLSRWTGLAWLAYGTLTSAGVAIGLLWLVHSLFAEHRVAVTRPEPLVSFAAVLLLALVTWTTPAILTTVLVVVVAFDRRNAVVLGLAVAFFLAFGAVYYYNLELTLLQKSGVLVGSGVLCLAGWAVLRSYSPSQRGRTEVRPYAL